MTLGLVVKLVAMALFRLRCPNVEQGVAFGSDPPVEYRLPDEPRLGFAATCLCGN